MIKPSSTLDLAARLMETRLWLEFYFYLGQMQSDVQCDQAWNIRTQAAVLQLNHFLASVLYDRI